MSATTRERSPRPPSVPPICILLRGSVVLPEVVALSQAMLRDGRFEPVVVTASGKAADAFRSATTTGLRAVRLDGTPHDRFPGVRKNDLASTAFRKNAGKRLKRITLNFRPLHAPILWRGLGADLRAAAKLIECIKPVAVATYSDRTPRPDMALLATAHRARVPTVLLPFAASTRESDAHVRRDASHLRFEHGPLAAARRVFARRNPGHAMDTEYGRMLFFSLWDGLALAGRGLHKTSPWVAGGGEINLMAVASPEDRESALAHGLSGERIRVTGQASLDALHRSRSERDGLRAALRTSYGLRQDRPIALCAVPHSAEHGLRSWSEHRADTTDLFQALGASGAEVLLSLHPKSEPAAYRESAKRFGLGVATEPLCDILPAADFFVAGFSSTVRWSAVLGIPTAIFDPARIGYKVYDGLPSVPKLTNAAELGCELSSLAGDPAWRARKAAALRTEGRRFGPIDGKACMRIIDLFDEIASTGRQQDIEVFTQ